MVEKVTSYRSPKMFLALAVVFLGVKSNNRNAFSSSKEYMTVVCLPL